MYPYHHHGNEVKDLFHRVFREQASTDGEMLISYVESLLVEMSKHDLPRFLQFLADMEIYGVTMDDLQEWWEENE